MQPEQMRAARALLNWSFTYAGGINRTVCPRA
jgi:hypothetical protein